MGLSTTKFARKLLQAGYHIVPTNSKKIAIVSWFKYQTKPMTLEHFDSMWEDSYGIGVLTGGAPRLICLDADMKYDLSGDLWDRFINSIPKDLFEKLYVQSTRNGGYHLVFKAPAHCLRPNEKLAARPTTADEKHQTYIEAYQNIDTKYVALKTALNDKSRILFETRGGLPDRCGGYFLMAPTNGYTYMQGKIQDITEDEYETLMNIARSFNQVLNLNKELKKESYSDNWEVNPFTHFDQEGDVVALLEENGWKSFPQIGKDIKFLRPGKSYATHSAILDTNTRVFYCYSTSTSFDVDRGYLPADVYCMLECGNDIKIAYQKLIELGFGIRKQ